MSLSSNTRYRLVVALGSYEAEAELESNLPTSNIQALTGDVTASGSGSVTATLSKFVNKVYVDFLDGNDLTGTGTPLQPWKTLQHAYNSINPTINRPYTICLSGGNNDTDSATISGKPNVNLFSEYPIQVNQNITITPGSTTNDNIQLFNIVLTKGFTWIRNDANVLSLGLINTTAFESIDFEQQGSGVSSSLCLIIYGGLTAGATFQVGLLSISAQSLYGAVTLKEAGAAVYLINGADLFTTNLSVVGGSTLYMYGNIPDTGYTLTASTGTSGTPTIISDCNSLPATISGTYTLLLTSLAKYLDYTATTPTDWNGTAPTDVNTALDRCAAALAALGHKP